MTCRDKKTAEFIGAGRNVLVKKAGICRLLVIENCNLKLTYLPSLSYHSLMVPWVKDLPAGNESKQVFLKKCPLSGRPIVCLISWVS